MRSLSVFAIVLLVGAAVLLIGCGGSNSNSNTSLTQAQAQQLAGEAYTVAANAMMSANISGSATEQFTSVTTRLDALRKRDLAPAPNQKSSQCNNCSLSGTYSCPSGGSIAVSGNITESINSASATSASLTVTETPASCSDGTLVINGNPSMTVAAQLNDDGTTTTLNLTLGGGISFAPVQAGQFPTGNCSSNVTANVSVSDSGGSLASCSVSGSICGQKVSGNCAN